MAKQIFEVVIEAKKAVEYTKYVVASTAQEAQKIAEKKFGWSDVDEDELGDEDIDFSTPTPVKLDDIKDIDTDEVLTDENEFEALRDKILGSEEYKNRQSKLDRDQALKQLFECYTQRLGSFEQADKNNFMIVLKKDGSVLTYEEFEALKKA
jgi:hypothetical protein